MEELRIRISRFMRMAYRWIVPTRGQLISGSDNTIFPVINQFEPLLKCLEKEGMAQPVLEGFQLFLSAYEDKDYVLAADYMETAVIDVLKNIVNDRMCDLSVPEVDEGYRVEITSVGAYTLKKETEGKTKYFHSNINPYMEGIQYVEKWYKKCCPYYCVAGLGMGYHVDTLGNPLTQIDIYEEDEKIIRLAEKYSDVWCFLKERKNVRIIHDPDYRQFIKMAQAIEEHNKEGSICVFHPAIQTIRDVKLGSGMKKLFLQLDNAKRWENIMLMNFRMNTERVTRSVEDLQKKIEGKRVYIIAGGPSLDKNIHLLKKRKSEDIVLTVGTSLRRCIQEEVKPDLAIITDPKPATYGQIAGVENCGVPLIILSTCYGYVARDYQGEKYLACQQGYHPAEKLAEKNNWMTVETGGSVATAALDIAIRLGAESVVFVGLDLAFTEGRSHQGLKNADVKAGTELMIPDVYGKPVATSGNLNLYRQWIEKRIARAKAEGRQTVFYDATEGGARVEGTTIVKLADLL